MELSHVSEVAQKDSGKLHRGMRCCCCFFLSCLGADIDGSAVLISDCNAFGTRTH
jgi:hypothetical protein